ncbi:hypothetical protein AVMA1855_17440 [Acidovorax sp. SUPP1855]|uniref:hypothetical protein n=1 Tax=Acidovorax sp. SUPP1855 TaxID=431774 RepID=UPI0023DE1F65|nr:hypothetical protein [Acidovorax sp. SUPP1855]GKS85962.1 hypothetical protein AVMA1855_17440 [Acidovorax sp. SUPP1855]
MKPLLSSPLRTPVLRAAALLPCLALWACSAKPPTPQWQMNAHGAARNATEAYLSGEPRIAQLEWDRARAEVARTGRPDLLARVELMRCAAQVASLVVEPCTAFEALRADAAPQDQAYADYLAGTIDSAAAARLPEPQRSAWAAGTAAQAGLADPLSRLVAAGVWVKTGRETPQVVDFAVEAASAQGWRRPLLAWLTLAAQRADQRGDGPAAAAARRRLSVLELGLSAEKR